MIETSRRGLLGLALAAAPLAPALLATPAIAQNRQRALRFGSPMSTNTTYHEAMVVFADELAKLSNNRLKVDLFPNAQLGGLKDMLTAVQLGTQSMLITVPAWYSNFIKQMDVLSLPFLVTAPERLRASLDGPFGERLSVPAAAAGFKLLTPWMIGPRHLINNVRPIHTPKDMEGLKLRVISSQVYLQGFRALGANPVAMDYSEVYLALQQKTIDGFDSGLPEMITGKYYEVTKFASLTEHITDTFIVGMNKALWDGFGAEEQAMIHQALKTATDRQWIAQAKTLAESRDKLNGLMTINDISATERAAFVEATRPVVQQFETSLGKDLVDEARRALTAA
jgi:tripartite ATP-independent transporter DctP family solute receptor